MIKLEKLSNTMDKIVELNKNNEEIPEELKKEINKCFENEASSRVNKNTVNDIIANDNTNILPGAISYSLPCQAIMNRGFHNEIKRLEIESHNKKLMSIYEKTAHYLADYLANN